MLKNKWLVSGCFLLTAAFLAAQQPELLAPDQLDNLVAPVALYPDELLGQVLAASTYPLELVEAQQWFQQNRGLQGPQLVDAARQQNWDPSVQAMVAFPNVLSLLSQDVRWTTDLGNAFLAQQADVMNAVQRLRARAQANGRLTSTPQETVTGGPSSIVIQPANPQVIYVPSYNPSYVWGAPAYGSYPALGYGDGGYGFSFNPGVILSALFSGLMSFGGWGWGLNWLAHALFLNNLFFGHFGFGGGGHGGYGGGMLAGGHSMWVHDPGHRMGVAYSNPAVASRYGSSLSGHAYSRPYTGNTARSIGSSGYSRDYRSPVTSASSYRSPSYGGASRSYNSASSYRAPSPSYSSNYRSAASSYRSSSYNTASRSTRSEAPARYSAPRSSAHFAKAPKAPKAPKFKAPKSSGGHPSGHSGGGKHK